MSRLFVGSLGFVVLAGVAAVGMPGVGLRAQEPKPPRVSRQAKAAALAADPAAERGRKQFGESCAFCHGADATGGRAPDLMRSPLVAHDVKGNLIGEVVHQGRPDKGMPALPLSDDQVADIAAFLHALLEAQGDLADTTQSGNVTEIRQQTWKLMSDVVDYHPACASVLQGLFEGLAAGCGRHIAVTMRAAAGGASPFAWSIG